MAVICGMIAQSDAPAIFEWLANAKQWGGGFVAAFANAALQADAENYALLRPVILQLRAKYPQYEPGGAKSERGAEAEARRPAARWSRVERVPAMTVS